MAATSLILFKNGSSCCSIGLNILWAVSNFYFFILDVYFNSSSSLNFPPPKSYCPQALFTTTQPQKRLSSELPSNTAQCLWFHYKHSKAFAASSASSSSILCPQPRYLPPHSATGPQQGKPLKLGTCIF